MGNIAKQLHELARTERRAIRDFDPSEVSGDSLSRKHKSALRILLKMEAGGKRLNGFHNYGCAIPTVPIPYQLMTQPRLVVDIASFADTPGASYQEKFQNRTGLTIPQFCRLAEEGFLIPNFYEFESQSKMTPAFALYDQCSGLDELLDRCFHSRIISIRRDKFFNSIFSQDFKRKADKKVSFFRKIVGQALSRGSLTLETLNSISRAPTPEAAYLRLANNWTNIAMFYGDDRTERLFSNIEDARRLILEVQASSLAVAGPYTAGFGGTLNISDEWLRRISVIPLREYRLDHPDDVREFSAERGAFSSAALELTRRALSGKAPVAPFPAKFEDQEFGGFIHFLKDREQPLSEAYDIFRRIGGLKGDQKFVRAGEYLTKMEECEKRVGYIRAGGKAVAETVPVLATGLVLNLSGELRSGRRSILGCLGLGLGIMFTLVASQKAPAALAAVEDDILNWWPGEHEVKIAKWKGDMSRKLI